MTTDEQYVQLLRETSKLIPLVDLGTCSKVYNLCMKHQLFEPINPIDFMLLLNIRETNAPVIIRSMKKARVCYLVYRLSKKELNSMIREQWIKAILLTCGIDKDYYDSHYKDLDAGKSYKLKKEASKTNAEKFVEDIDSTI
ncbi:MAG: hypothetical protein Q4E68_09630 [Prevotellaceae bacterium]|nr:hypothetical protein [Prevotellaceae bacterium]